MKKIVLIFSILFGLFTVSGCNEKDEEVAGKLFLGNTGYPFASNETYHAVVPIEWTGESPVIITSVELIKRDKKPINYEEDGIKYDVFGADPSKKTGVWGESDIGDLKNLDDSEIDREGKIALKLTLGDVKEDPERRVKINFINDGEESEKIVVWKTLEMLTTDKN
ncbi:hypothetical protein IEO70_12905 [Bacillus sp. AGMB 02131]|uniref:Uncharacterized protein n=1 Tax=Peribacillus faecalis TaxID=2772559 RepID=A0A927CX79_9BACI|nr:hypothetical protein [Peribacillus faecalis]MBD3109246.1 hypothetical protein [Peribacillus faecalis]